MATSIFPFLVAFLLLAATASARPCKPLFFFSVSTTTTTFNPLNPHHGNPNPNSLPRGHNPRQFTLIFTATSQFPILRRSIDSPGEDSRSSPPSDFPLNLYSAVSSSLRDRSRDIITVVAALAAMILGAGCGILSAAAVYLVYFILSRRCNVGSDDVESCDVAVAKRHSYSPIPSGKEVV